MAHYSLNTFDQCKSDISEGIVSFLANVPVSLFMPLYLLVTHHVRSFISHSILLLTFVVSEPFEAQWLLYVPPA
jgi:hypothetical protein